MSEQPNQQLLPYIEQRKISHLYARRANNSNKKQMICLNKQSERVKADYLKLCKKIKFSYGLTRRDREDNNVTDPKKVQSIRCTTQPDVSPLAKIIIRDYSSRKVDSFIPFETTKNQKLIFCRPVLKSNDSFTSGVIQSPTYKRKSFGQQRQGQLKKLDPIINFLTKKHESQWMSIERLKIVRRPKQDNKNSLVKQLGSQKVLKIVGQDEQTSPVRNKSMEEKFQKQIICENNSQIYLRKSDIFSKSESSNRSTKGLKNIIKQKSLKKIQTNLILSPSIPRRRPFILPFDTYYYHDFIWKCAFSNQMIVEPPLQYEHRLRVFIGKGNNAGLIRGLMKRRIWFGITEKLEQANFVWTQIKNVPYLNAQQTTKTSSILNKQQPIQPETQKLKHTYVKGVLNSSQRQIFESYFHKHINSEQRADQRFVVRNKYLKKMRVNEQVGMVKVIKSVEQIKMQRMQNHLINNYIIGNKKALFKLMAAYYQQQNKNVFHYLPLTFHIQQIYDQNYNQFLKHYNQLKKSSKYKNIWIVKPGEYSNRGNGIRVCHTLDDIKSILKVKQKYFDGTSKTHILQTYIQNPLLYYKRKFDLRHYMMISCINGILKGYWYQEGYVRTTSFQFTLQTKNSSIHLTNDAVQKQLPDYGRYEKGNKISYDDLQNYLLKGYKDLNFKEHILPKMKEITTDIVKACSGSIDPQLHQNNFQIFGLDFMIDENYNVWLIEVNTNPCLELSCPLLTKLIPRMVQNSLEITTDSIFRPPVRYNPKGMHYYKKLEDENQFDLIYDSRLDGFYEVKEVIDSNMLNQQEQIYEDQGEEWNEND